MKTFVRSILFSSALAIGANSLMAAQANDTWANQRFREKLGRYSHTEEARQKTERANSAFRKEISSEVATPPTNWIEHYDMEKYGRSSPREESRQKADQANIAFREETNHGVARTNWTEQDYREKYGRSSPRGEAPSKAVGR